MAVGLIPLVLSVKRRLWRKNDADSDHKNVDFQKARPEVMARDNQTCRYCGLTIRSGAGLLEVHHVDDNHANNDPKNLATACKLDHAVHHIGMNKLSRLAYLPGLSLSDLSNLLRTLLVAMASNDPVLSEKALRVYRSLCLGQAPFSEAWGSDESADLANALLSLDEVDYAARGESLEGVAFLPDIQDDGEWRKWGDLMAGSSAYSSLPVDVWADIAESVTKRCERFVEGGIDIEKEGGVSDE